jgi:hypothetical protein
MENLGSASEDLVAKATRSSTGFTSEDLGFA